MEKTHLEVNINGKAQDCVISYFMQPKKNDEEKVMWTNTVYEITAYVKDDNKVSVVKLSTLSVKSLAHIEATIIIKW